MAVNLDNYTQAGMYFTDTGVEETDTNLFQFALIVQGAENAFGDLAQIMLEIPSSTTTHSVNVYARGMKNGLWLSWKSITSKEAIIDLIKDNAHLSPIIDKDIKDIKKRLDKLEGNNNEGGIDLGQLTTTLYNFGVSSNIGLKLDTTFVNGLIKHGHMISFQASIDVTYNTTIARNIPLVVMDARCKPDQRFGAKAVILASSDRNSKLRDVDIDLDSSGRIYFAENETLAKGNVVEFNFVYNKMSELIPRTMELELDEEGV